MIRIKKNLYMIKLLLREKSCACAVYLHGAAADRAAAVHGEYGMLPHDILPELGRMFAEHQR